MISDVGRFTADAAKLRRRLGCLGRHPWSWSLTHGVAASMSDIDLSQAPQMAVVPEFRDNYHLEDLDHHLQRGPSLHGVERCVAA